MVAETCNAREGADVLSSISTAKAVGLLHFTRIAQRVRRARMFVMQEDGKLGSNGITLRGHCLSEEVILYVLR
jgi:hypothetical protein